ncbi:unnamed protein product [Arabidopsis lyrata]|uniref:Uncharacterized protein n=1 Tax=Arabidopsis lyrata subsp. lyrata TaxID=81972 RepID=D7LTC7_ARALL|nr:hypothetical protein ARALYDRAFT_907884 [Arabidopsis lyrata subsp. lyrata]CAH8269564.1 unnamed protein product [Arabidopsis lyrata]
MAHISDIKLIRTDTTLDLSQKAEKGMICKLGSTSDLYLGEKVHKYHLSDVGEKGINKEIVNDIINLEMPSGSERTRHSSVLLFLWSFFVLLSMFVVCLDRICKPRRAGDN